MIPSYSEIFNFGHKLLENLFNGKIIIEEKVDGSQFSFCKKNSELFCRSKGKEINLEAPEKLFSIAVNVIKNLDLREGWIYRGEFLQKPKHNTLEYSRIPKNNIVIFDIDVGDNNYLEYREKKQEAERIGLEVVPLLFEGEMTSLSEEELNKFLATPSFLGKTTIEGIVIKNYNQFGKDKKVLMGKFVSEQFKEVNKRNWRKNNPTFKDVIQNIVFELKTEARWNKAIQHLREEGKLTETPADIGNLIQEVQMDILKEEEDYIKNVLFDNAINDIKRGVVKGIAEWYKKKLITNKGLDN